MNIERNTEFAGYRIIDVLGRGGQGTVFKVQNRIGTHALKVLNGGVEMTTKLRFQREYRLLTDIDHPGLCHVKEIGVHEDHYYIAMDYIDGTTLATMLQEDDGLSFYAPADASTHVFEEHSAVVGRRGKPIEDYRTALLWTVHLCYTLGYIHERHIIHRDVKPGNIMIDKDDNPVLLDFGLAFRQNKTRLTRGFDIIGTAYYMSPEQTVNSGEVDCRTDIFSLGVTLYEMLTGTRPFQGESRSEVLDAIRTSFPVAATSLNRDLPDSIDEVLTTAMAKEREQRYTTAQDFLKDISEKCLGLAFDDT